MGLKISRRASSFWGNFSVTVKKNLEKSWGSVIITGESSIRDVVNVEIIASGIVALRASTAGAQYDRQHASEPRFAKAVRKEAPLQIDEKTLDTHTIYALVYSGSW